MILKFFLILYKIDYKIRFKKKRKMKVVIYIMNSKPVSEKIFEKNQKNRVILP